MVQINGNGAHRAHRCLKILILKCHGRSGNPLNFPHALW
jgi:hypothetical protein